jgi:hypothetical protein
MLRPVLGFLTFFVALALFADNPLPAQDKGGKKHTHECVLVKVDPTNHTIVVDFREKKKKPQPYKLVESVKIIDKHGHVIKIDVFKKGDHVKIVESEGMVHELHHKTHSSKAK